MQLRPYGREAGADIGGTLHSRLSVRRGRRHSNGPHLHCLTVHQFGCPAAADRVEPTCDDGQRERVPRDTQRRALEPARPARIVDSILVFRGGVDLRGSRRYAERSIGLGSGGPTRHVSPRGS